MLNLLRYEIFSRRYAILLGYWSAGLLPTMYVTVYPEFADQMGDMSNLAIYKLMGIDLAHSPDSSRRSRSRSCPSSSASI